jgi:hypothetical protein
MRRRFFAVLAVDTLLALIAAGFALAHFHWGLSWGLYAFYGLIVAAFAVQLWFVRSVGRMKKGN